MSYLLIILSLMSISISSFADPDFDKLKLSFGGQLKDAIQKLDVAKKMKPSVNLLSAYMPYEECKKAELQIISSNIINPFEFIFEGGSAYNYMCGGSGKWRNNFYSAQKGLNYFGLSYDYIIQLKTTDENKNDLGFSSYFFDKSNQLIQEEYSYYDYNKNLVVYAVSAKDLAGDYYQNQVYNSMSIPQKNITGLQTLQVYVSHDGSQPSGVFRNQISDKNDSKKYFETIYLSRADKVDWNSYELPLSHAWSGGFYNYNGKWFNASNFRSSLTIKYKDGTEICSTGHIKTDLNWSMYPLDTKDYYDCENY